jgi:UDP-4-amino-4,6-dideoxy-N-acetyl-beta-L-altrosamine transaminase
VSNPSGNGFAITAKKLESSDMIPYGKQDITDDDVEAITQVLRSDFLTQGPAVPAFEAAVARYTGAEHAVAVNSATSALHLACLALGLQKGDTLWTSPITFVASANCALYCGASVDFVDIDPTTFNISVVALEKKLEAARSNGKLPKALLPVHMCGQSCDMQAIHRLSKEYGFRVIEDASHAIGGRYRGEKIGNCRYSDITIFSFHPVKIITSAEGGMALTNDAGLAQTMALLRSHGITREPEQMTQEADGPWFYQQIALGFNYRMTDIQAALGLSQMNRLDHYVSKRHELADRYNEAFQHLPVITPWQHPDTHSSFHLYVVRLQDLGIHSRRQVFDGMRASGIGVNVHYIPVHTQPYYQAQGFAVGDFPEAERYYTQALTLPLYPGMTNLQQQLVVNTLTEVLA